MLSALDYVIGEGLTLKDAIEKLNAASGKQLVVLNPKNKVVGVLGNSEVRKAMLRGSLLSSPLADHANTRFIAIQESQEKELRDLFTEHLISTIPIVDKDSRLLKIAAVMPPHYDIRIIPYQPKKSDTRR